MAGLHTAYQPPLGSSFPTYFPPALIPPSPPLSPHLLHAASKGDEMMADQPARGGARMV